jgi:class 3 adenylate cyclase
VDVEALRAAGLYDPAAPDAPDRLALLEYLLAQDLSIEWLVDADRVGMLHLAAALPLLRPDGAPLTRAQLATLSDLDEETVEHVYRALGVAHGPDARFADSDLKTLGAFQLGTALFDDEVLLQFVRVIGSALDRIADAAMALANTWLGPSLDDSEAAPIDVAWANRAAIQVLLTMPDFVEPVFRRHVEQALRRTAAAGANVGERGTVQRVIGFLDLVGFTELSQQLPVRTLATFIGEFEALCADAVAGSSARVVKMIGDEVMFVALDAADGCRVALELCARVEAHPGLPSLRGALAAGPCLAQDGDYYGPVVSLASRAVKRAQPGANLLATSGVVESPGVTDLATIEPMGEHRLRGFADPVPLWAVRRR